MSLPILNLKTATPNEINAAVATHIAGHYVEMAPKKDVGYWIRGEDRWYAGPNYLTDANAVLSLLYRTHWEAYQITTAHPVCVSIYHSVVASAPRTSGEADTLPRAACIALLRASGKVTVLD